MIRGKSFFGTMVLLPLTLLALTILIYPIFSLVQGANFGSLPQLLQSWANVQALVLSLLTATLAACLALITGFPLALYLAKANGFFPILLRALVLVPLVLPPVVSGLALLLAFGRGSLIEPLLDLLGVQIVFTTAAVVLAQLFVSLPFVVLALEGAFASSSFAPERTAATLGAGPARVFWTITFRRFLPAILLAFLLAFARSLGEFGATLTFAGSLEGVSRTLPLQIYLLRETDLTAAVTLAVLTLLLALLVVVLAYARGPQKRGRN